MFNIIQQYFEKRIQLIRLEATEKGAKLSGLFFFFIILLIFISFFLSFFIIGMGIWIGEQLGNYAYGFLIMSAICFLLFILCFLLRKPIQNFATNTFIKFLN